ncbi:MAG TPA: hypothetical protein VFC86_03880, partial [Planctomycetota bacterium]|nr:hypothetical protein [Planctomycetota bacterium]
RHARRAVELYPTSAYHRYLLGRILDESGQEGASEFREALRLSALAVRVPRLKLDGLQTAVATAKTGGTTEQAVAIYSKQPRKRVAAALLAPVEQSIVDAAGNPSSFASKMNAAAVERALSEFSRWATSPRETRRAELAIAMLEDAIRRRPRYPTLHARMAEIQEALSRHLKLSAAGIEMAASEALLLEAERHARRAVELYPTSAYHRYLLGRILDESGQEGASEFREALRLSALAVRVPRLRLDGLQTAVATAKTGGTTEQAVAIYSKQRRKRVAAALLAPVEQSIVDAAGESK